METWATVWKVVLVVGLAVFAGMSVWVTIGGALDIKRLLRRMDEDRSDSDD